MAEFRNRYGVVLTVADEFADAYRGGDAYEEIVDAASHSVADADPSKDDQPAKRKKKPKEG